MLIGNKYADNKMYRGIKHYNSLPLTSEDIHEYADTLQMKNYFFMNNVIGSGTLNEPLCSISSTGISLSSPSVVLIDGDISLIKSDQGALVSMSDIVDEDIEEGIVCIVGWYQQLTANSTLRAYGGVKNSILPNDLLDTRFNVQVSTRYQLRWDTVIIDAEDYAAGGSLSLSIPARDAHGNITSGEFSFTTVASTNTVRTATKPVDMTYSVSDLYIVPILNYNYSEGTVTNAKAYQAIKPLGANSFISSTTEPTGDNFTNGAIWWNPETYKFRLYVKGVGFVPTASELSLIQYYNIYTFSGSVTVPANITIDIGISSYNSNDILQVLYNGAVLTKDQQYTVDLENNQITLLSHTVESGDTVTFLVVKLVDNSTAASISDEFTQHLMSYGSSIVKGHVSLSDSANQTLGVERNVAATPKSVYDATTITDSVTGKKYRLTMTNGVLGTTEIQ